VALPHRIGSWTRSFKYGSPAIDECGLQTRLFNHYRLNRRPNAFLIQGRMGSAACRFARGIRLNGHFTARIRLMGWEAWLALTVVVGCFGMIAFTRISPDIVLSGGLTILLVSGPLLPEEALAGFPNHGRLTVAVLYIVVSGLTKTGAIGCVVQYVLGRARGGRQAQVRLMAPAAALSAFLNNTPAVAVFLPAVKM
jgi:hypothetical protein